MLGHLRLNLCSLTILSKDASFDSNSAVRRLCNVAMVIIGAAGFSPSYVAIHKAGRNKSRSKIVTKDSRSKNKINIRMAIDEDWMSPRSETQLSNDNPKVISPQALRMAISHMSKSDAGRAQLCRPDGTSLETSLITLARGHSMSETEFEREARKLLKPQVAKSLAKLAADISVSQRTLGGKGILKLMDAGGNLSGTQSFKHFSPGGVGGAI